MTWFLIALLAPAFWSATNHIDKYLLERYFKGGGEGALFIFSSAIGLVFLPLVLIIHPEALSYPLLSGLLITLNGSLYILGLIPSIYALKRGEVSVTIPLFQMVPVFSFILAWIILGETLTLLQMLGGIIVIGGSIALSLEMSEVKKIVFNKTVFLLMLLSSLLLSFHFVLFKVFAIESTLMTTIFWEYIGFALTAICLFVFIPIYRKQFIRIIKENKGRTLTLNGANEVLNLMGKFSFNFASLLVPIALVWFIAGLQPIFVFVYGLILTLFFPHISKEKITKGHLIHRITAICVMLIGTVLLYI